jgi:Fe2+ or Zn2+ uptake regulation protein
MITNKQAGRDTPAAALHARGKRLTRPRRVILDAVRASEAHPSVAAVYRQVRRRLPRVSLATVYRNLRMLAAEGLVTERADLAGMRFDGNTTPHDHFTCVACGRIYDVPAATARGVRARVASRTGFEVLVHRIEFYGRCGACRRRGRLTRPPQPRRSHGRAKPEGDQELRESQGGIRR